MRPDESIPREILVVGSGRWARQIIGVLSQIVPAASKICVYSRSKNDSLVAWLETAGLSARVSLATAWQPLIESGWSAAIVVNATENHESAAVKLLEAGIPTLVEKPLALSAAGAARLLRLSASTGTILAAGHVLRFARYLEGFSRAIAESGALQRVSLDWEDPVEESRYGEQKRFDSSVPILRDLAPHVLSVADSLGLKLSDTPVAGALSRGGAILDLSYLADGIPFHARIARNASRRRRHIEVITSQRTLRLDFSIEPGVVDSGNDSFPADSLWGEGPRPLARMLTAFLVWASGGEFDSRLDAARGAYACSIADRSMEWYREAQRSWIIEELHSHAPAESDLSYAIIELLQARGRLSERVLQKRLAASLKALRGVDRQHLAGLLHCSRYFPVLLEHAALDG